MEWLERKMRWYEARNRETLGLAYIAVYTLWPYQFAQVCGKVVALVLGLNLGWPIIFACADKHLLRVI